MVRRACMIVVALALPAALAAQEDVLSAPADSRVVVVVESLEQTEPDSLTSRILVSNIADLLTGYGFEYRTAQLTRDEGFAELPDERRISTILGGVDTDAGEIVIGVFFLAAQNQLFVQFVLYDPQVNTVLGGVLTRSRQGLTVFDSVAAAIEDFRPVIERYISGEYIALERTGLVESITVEGGTEGAGVFFVNRFVGTIGGGRLFVPFTQFEIGADLRVRQEKDGYHDVETVVPLESTRVGVELRPLQRETRFDLGVHWSWGQSRGVGIAGRYHLVPDTSFVAIEHYRTLQEAPTDNARNVSFYDSNIAMGRYFFLPYSSILRFSLSLGVGAIVSDVDDLSGREYVDWYILVGSPTAEINLERLSFFVRPELKYALGLGYNVLGRVWVRTAYETDDGSVAVPPVTVGARYSW